MSTIFTGPQLHLALNHLPVVGVLIATLTLLAGALAGSGSLRRFGLALAVLAAVAAVPVYLTGEPAEEAVEHQPGVMESAIERHEAAAQAALAITLVAGALAAAAWLAMGRGRPSLARPAFMLALAASVAATGALARTAHLGGAIRHGELRAGGAVSDVREGAVSPEAAAAEADDD
ncbi:MAG TPA: DUF2231 domain-containing protein [Candidatus Binatia bacterium]|nr:DUF2231 domain-containing protein [Candidatus Binatia bacterium]